MNMNTYISTNMNGGGREASPTNGSIEITVIQKNDRECKPDQANGLLNSHNLSHDMGIAARKMTANSEAMGLNGTPNGLNNHEEST